MLMHAPGDNVTRVQAIATKDVQSCLRALSNLQDTLDRRDRAFRRRLVSLGLPRLQDIS